MPSCLPVGRCSMQQWLPITECVGPAPTVDEFGAGAAFHREGASREPARVPRPQEGVELSVGIAVVVVIAQH